MTAATQPGAPHPRAPAQGHADLLLHADADAFFASVEAARRPDLADQPFVVGLEEHGVVACPNYPARALGVHGGMTLRAARQRCPRLTVVPPDYQAYRQASEHLFEIFGRHAAVIEPGSMEEAFLDVTGREPLVTARSIRQDAAAELGLPVSVGVGRTKLIAKLASRRAKPDGLVVIAGSDEQHLRDTLRIADVWGVGETTRERLCDLGVHTVRDLDGVPPETLTAAVGLAMSRRLCSIAAGTDDATVRVPKPSRLIRGERSVSPTSRSRHIVGEIGCAATDSAVDRLTERGHRANRVEVMLTFDDHQRITVRSTLTTPTDNRSALQQVVAGLLDDSRFVDDGRGVYRVRTTLTLHRPSEPISNQPALPFDLPG